MTLEWRELEPFGAEIDHDLSNPLSAAEAEQLRALFNERSLLLARSQRLTMAQQRETCAHLGPILLREGETGYLSNEAGGPSASELIWHSDAAYTEHPFDALSLHALEVVDGASSTRFANAGIALPDDLSFANAGIALPDDLSCALTGRQQDMIAPHYTELAQRTCDRRDPPGQKQGVMPAFKVNPHNGRPCLWVNAMQTARIRDMAWEDSRDLLHAVYDRLYDPANVYEHVWRNGDLIIWDNIALQHMRANVEGVGRRLLQRVIVGVEGVAPHLG